MVSGTCRIHANNAFRSHWNPQKQNVTAQAPYRSSSSSWGPSLSEGRFQHLFDDFLAECHEWVGGIRCSPKVDGKRPSNQASSCLPSRQELLSSTQQTAVACCRAGKVEFPHRHVLATFCVLSGKIGKGGRVSTRWRDERSLSESWAENRYRIVKEGGDLKRRMVLKNTSRAGEPRVVLCCLCR